MAPFFIQSPVRVFRRQGPLNFLFGGHSQDSSTTSTESSAPTPTLLENPIANPTDIINSLTSAVGGVLSSAPPPSSTTSSIEQTSTAQSSVSSAPPTLPTSSPSPSSVSSIAQESSSSSSFTTSSASQTSTPLPTSTPPAAPLPQSTASLDASDVAAASSVTSTFFSVSADHTVFYTTVVPAPTSSSSSPTLASATAAPKSFLENKPLEGGVFAAAGLVALIVLISLSTIALRKTRKRRLDREADEAMSVPEMFEQIASEESFHEKSSSYGGPSGRRGSAGGSDEGLIKPSSERGFDYEQQAYSGFASLPTPPGMGGSRQQGAVGYPYDVSTTVPAAAYQRSNALPSTVPASSYAPNASYGTPGPNTIGQPIIQNPWDPRRGAAIAQQQQQVSVTRSGTVSSNGTALSRNTSRYVPPSQMYDARSGRAPRAQQQQQQQQQQWGRSSPEQFR